MPDYLKKLTAIQKKCQKLQENKLKLIEMRKTSIAQLAEQFDLLTADDKILSDFFAQFREFANESRQKTLSSTSKNSST